MAEMMIAGLARAGGVGVETVRYYQRRGLIRMPRRPDDGGAVRRYEAQDVRRLRFIRAAQRAGFTLDEIAILIDLDAGQDRKRARQLAVDRIAALDIRIAELQSARDALTRLARECGATARGSCPIIAAFEEDVEHHDRIRTKTRPA